LSISLDRIYPRILEECREAIRMVLPEARVGTRGRKGSRALVVYSYSPHWLCLFPQHGAGRKHLRHIALTDWQLTAIKRHRRELLRGLIHSDGCRSVNRVKTAGGTYQYARYFFRNASEDILGIFAETCDVLGVAWTRSGPRTISVSKRSAVAMLDAWVGPKA
jgi:hypothetical protein